ncbi:unnamed protein product [Allacma fusca]|uniref:FLYWCH-type domain-containing protein n=1 Tax=Allacma fusca TaxID=39272 RepID=A0A8J2JPD4_9HEXA|nr:unnamed protein product [Allacma fusca]
MSYTDSQKGARVLWFKGFQYIKNSSSGSTIYWKCRSWSAAGCPGRLIDREGVKSESIPHCNHEISAIQQQVEVFKSKFKRRAITHPNEKPAVLINEVKTGIQFNKECAPALPSTSIIAKYPHKWRKNEAVQGFGNPSRRQDIFIPDNYQVTEKGDRFLLYDSRDKDRILIFTTQQNIEMSSPPLTPVLAVMDFEQAAVQAFTEVFESVEVQGCLFHLSQSVYRNVPKEVKAKIAHGDTELELAIKYLPALATIPISRVGQTYEEIRGELLDKYPDMKPLLDYFRRTYIGSATCGARFSIPMWNVHRRIIQNFPRTNNSVEGWNNRLNLLVAATKPSLAHILRVLRMEQSRVEEALLVFLAGSSPPIARY